MRNQYGLPSRIRVVDTTNQVMSGDILFPFAYEEIECRRVGNGAEPLLHIWRHQKAFVLGLRDRKLPNAQGAMKWLEEQGYATAVRHSGGAAVPLDQGVINLSLIVPKAQGMIDFRDDFQTMVDLIALSLNRFHAIDTGEVVGSYCPGDYDLSIQGKKFCGIAQRRQTQASIIQAFVVVEGKGERKAQVAQDFYRLAGQNGELNYPDVRTSSMASLSELVGLSSAEGFVAHIRDVLTDIDVEITQDYDTAILSDADVMMNELKKRYDK